MQKNGSASLDSRIDSLKKSVRNLVDAGEERAGNIKDRAIGVKDSVFENSEAAISRARVLVKEHPFAALGIALGVGYIAIRILRK